MAAQLKPPSGLSFEGNVAQNWKEFRRAFELYLKASKTDKEGEDVQVATLLHVAGTQAQAIHSTFTFTATEEDKLKPVIDKFEAYCQPRKNITVCRYMFNSRQQKEGESFIDYLTVLKTLVKDCEFDTLQDDLLRDRIVCGIRDERVRARLLRIDELTLQKAIDTVTVSELSTEQLKSLSIQNPPATPSPKVDAVARGRRFNRGARGGRGTRGFSRGRGYRDNSRSRVPFECPNCPYNHAPGNCPAYDQECRKCREIGHFAARCDPTATSKTPTRGGRSSSYRGRSLANRGIKTVELDGDEAYEECEVYEEYDPYPFAIDCIENVHSLNACSDWTETCQVSNQDVTFKLDSGAQVDIIPKETFDELPLQLRSQIESTEVTLRSYSNHRIRPLGQIKIDTMIKGKTWPVVYQIVQGKASPILGKETCERVGLIKRVLSVKTDQRQTEYKVPRQSAKFDNQSAKSKPDESVSPSVKSQCPSVREKGKGTHKPSPRAQALVEKNKDLFEGLGCLKKHQYNIEIDPNVPPVKHPPRTVPHKIYDQVKAELDRMVDLDVIEPVTEPTEWVNSMTTVVKSNGKVRICLDPRDLNKAIRRQHYPMNTIEEVAARMPGAKIFSKFDATAGYWQLRLTEESSKLTTFNTPWGRYKYKRMPFGISSASEIWQRAMIEEFGDITGLEIIVDDMTLWAATDETHDDELEAYFDRVRESGLKLNWPKSDVSTNSIEYSGHEFTDEGLKPSPDRIRALTEIPSPENKGDLENFLGIMVYLAKFVPNLSKLAEPLRQLLQKGVEWSWESWHQAAFEQLVQAAVCSPALQWYDAKKPVVVSTDASNKGFGAMISQDEKPVAYASRKLAQAEVNYAPIEKEMSAILFGCSRFHDYIFGGKTIVETDHKPLVGIFDKPLYKLSPRLQRMRMALLRYDLEIRYKPGKELLIPDALSRAAVDNATPEQNDSVMVDSIVAQLPVSDERLLEIREKTTNDPTLSAVSDLVTQGWPDDKSQVPPVARPYHTFRHEITYCNGLLFRGHQIIIPSSMRSELLSQLHTSHQGIVKSKQRAKSIMFWPGMSTQIEDLVSKCSICMEFRSKRPPEPMIMHEIPDRPWAKVGTDLFELGSKNYMIMVDYYSKYPEVVQVPDKTGQAVVTASKSVFARQGTPEKVVSDNGPCYDGATFRNFAAEWNFEHVTISAGYSQSNGQVENTVKSVKRLMKKAYRSGGDFYNSLLEFRNTPLDGTNGYSPSQLLNSRVLRSKLPTATALLKPHVVPPMHSHLKARQLKQKEYYDRNASHSVPQPEVGQHVRFRNGQNQWEFGKVKEILPQPRSVIVESQTGREFKRNRRHMYTTKEVPPIVELPNDEFEDHVRLGASHNATPSKQSAAEATCPLPSTPHVSQSPKIVSHNEQQMTHSPNSQRYSQVTLRPNVTTRSGRISKATKKMDL